MKDLLVLIANCLGITASIGGFILALRHLWRGEPTAETARRKLARRFALGLVMFTGLLVFLSFSLKHNIEMLEQSGTFVNYSRSDTEIYYKIPYAKTPHLEFTLRPSDSAYEYALGPRILQQRADGFKVRIDGDSYHFVWNATGIQKK